jgi:hypothetical protein
MFFMYLILFIKKEAKQSLSLIVSQMLEPLRSL